MITGNSIYSAFEAGDMRLQYILDGNTMGMRILPLGMENDVIAEKKCTVEPLVQLHIAGDAYAGGFSQGRTMRGGATTHNMRFVSQSSRREDGTLCVETLMKDDRGIELCHTVKYIDGTRSLRVFTTIINASSGSVNLEMLSSFAMGALTPFESGAGEMRLHRLLSTWSNEAQPLSQMAYEMQVEPSWAPGSSNSVRFGQVGSMPVRGWAPVAGVTDTKKGVTWACRLTHAYSWQLEFSCQDEGLAISGGMADREFGHFMKTLVSGEKLDAPEAIITVTKEGFDEACFRMIDECARPLSVNERDLPSIYNEYCTTWGRPSADLIAKIADTISGRGFRYFVIDAGWYANNDQNWSKSAGDWQVSTDLFPQGLDAALDVMRAKGLIPGIWFEFEVCSEGSRMFHNADYMLKRDGVPIQSGMRRFLDFTKPEVRAHVKKCVIDFLNAHGIGYIKVDYNETIGIGADGAESQGEKLREHVLAVQSFFEELRAGVPGITIEVCSSGGHKIVTSYLDRCDMVSFSDAHECDGIPVVAKNVLRMAEMSKSQIWAVIKREQDLKRIYYRMTGAMLGHICVSGDVTGLTDAQWKVVDDGVKFHAADFEFVERARTRFYGTPVITANRPTGWQAVTRERDGRALVIVHAFRGAPQQVELDIDGAIEAVYCRDGIDVKAAGGKLTVSGLTDFDGVALRMKLAK